MDDLISVIVPVYNVENYLGRCLDSLLKQSHKNLEIIIVNDGSTDNSGEICNKYKLIDERIKVIHKENGGLSSARNIGIAASQGHYIGFVDSDDWLSYDMYEHLYSILLEHDADIAISSFVRCSSLQEGQLLAAQKNSSYITTYTQDEYIKKFMKIDSQTIEYYAWNKLYKRDLLTNEHYPEGLTAEDVLGTFKALLHTNKIVKSDRVTYFYFVNPESITADFNVKKANDLLMVWDSVVELSKNHPEYYRWALLNRKRIDFSILFQIAVSKNRGSIIGNYPFISELTKRLSHNKKELLGMNISKVRKVLIYLFCWDYFITSKILYSVSWCLRVIKK